MRRDGHAMSTGNRMNIEELIQKAINDGKFEDLPGRGQPLHLEENPFEDPDWRLANKILKDNGFSPAWIETRKEIEAAITEARKAARLAWQKYQTTAREKADYAVETRWNEAQRKLIVSIQAINQLIFKYNIQAPSMQVQIRSYDAAEELARIIETGAGDVSSSIS